jgi:hypothetical protein
MQQVFLLAGIEKASMCDRQQAGADDLALPSLFPAPVTSDGSLPSDYEKHQHGKSDHAKSEDS